MNRFLSVYITAASLAEAQKIAYALVEARLSACANIFTGVHSVYRWQGQVETAEEVAMIVKTRAEDFAAVERKVKELHSYACPCIVAWPIEAGHQPYLDAVDKETKRSAGSM